MKVEFDTAEVRGPWHNPKVFVRGIPDDFQRGKYTSRDELEYWVRRWYYNESNTSQADVARACGVSATTVKLILKNTTPAQLAEATANHYNRSLL